MSFHTHAKLSRVVTVLPALLLSSCVGAQQPAEGADAANNDEVEQEGEALSVEEHVARARQIAKSVYANPAPMPSGELNNAESLRFAQGPLKEWFEKTSHRVKAAADEFRFAVDTATPEELSQYGLEVAELWAFFADGFLTSGSAAMPPKWRQDPDVAAAYLGALGNGAKPYYEAVIGASGICLEVAEKHGLAAPHIERCRELNERFSALAAEVPARSTVHSQSVDVESTFTPNETLLRKPCRLSGSVQNVSAALYSGTNAGEPVAIVKHAHLTLLTLARANGRHTVSLAWPIRATAHIDVTAEIFAPTTRIDVDPPNVWLGPGTRVRARAATNGHATIHWRASIRLSKDSIDERIPCSKLSFAHQGLLEGQDTSDGKTSTKMLSQDQTLHARPGGKFVADLGLMPVRVLTERDGWVRVKILPNDQVMLDGWVRNTNRTFLREAVEFGQIGLLNDRRSSGHSVRQMYLPQQPTHRTKQTIPLFTGANGPDTPVGHLAKDVPLVVFETRGDNVKLAVFGLKPVRGAFWIRKADIGRTQKLRAD